LGCEIEAFGLVEGSVSLLFLILSSLDETRFADRASLPWFTDALLGRSLMGVERKSRLVSEESLNTSAYIEGGHALVALLTPHSVPLHKV